MAIELTIRKPLQAKLERLDIDTARMLTDSAEAKCRAALGWCLITKSRLGSARALDEGACTVLASASTELADKASALHQIALSLAHMMGDGDA